MTQITNIFLVMKKLEVSIVAKTPKGKYFVSRKGQYVNIACNSFLVFKYKSPGFTETYVPADNPEVWFTYHHLYELSRSFRYFFKKLEYEIEQDDDNIDSKYVPVFVVDPESGMASVSAEYSSIERVVQGANDNAISMKFSVAFNENLNQQDVGIEVFIKSKNFRVFMTIEYVGAIATFLNNMNLLQLTQNMIAIEYANLARPAMNHRHVSEE